jgi:hypothetical protein
MARGAWRGVTDYFTKLEHGWHAAPTCTGADAIEAVKRSSWWITRGHCRHDIGSRRAIPLAGLGRAPNVETGGEVVVRPA